MLNTYSDNRQIRKTTVDQIAQVFKGRSNKLDIAWNTTMTSNHLAHVLNTSLRWNGWVRCDPERREGFSIDLDRDRCRGLSLARLGDSWGKLTKRMLGETRLRGNPPKETTSYNPRTRTRSSSRRRQRFHHHVFVVHCEKWIQCGFYSSQSRNSPTKRRWRDTRTGQRTFVGAILTPETQVIEVRS